MFPPRNGRGPVQEVACACDTGHDRCPRWAVQFSFVCRCFPRFGDGLCFLRLSKCKADAAHISCAGGHCSRAAWTICNSPLYSHYTNRVQSPRYVHTATKQFHFPGVLLVMKLFLAEPSDQQAFTSNYEEIETEAGSKALQRGPNCINTRSPCRFRFPHEKRRASPFELRQATAHEKMHAQPTTHARY